MLRVLRIIIVDPDPGSTKPRNFWVESKFPVSPESIIDLTMCRSSELAVLEDELDRVLREENLDLICEKTVGSASHGEEPEIIGSKRVYQFYVKDKPRQE
jgi:hypothetical protein